MADRYVDLSGDWEASQTGADHTGNEWKGPYGLQKAGDTVNAGDTVYIKDTADMRRLFRLNLGKDIVAAGWVVGDTLKDNNTGNEWEGVYTENIDTDSIVVELIAGDIYGDVINGNGVNNITKADTTTITSKEKTFQLNINNINGTLGFLIKLIGVNSAWVDDGTRCVFDGHGINGNTLYLLDIHKHYYHIKNMEFDDGDYRGIHLYGDNLLVENIYVHHCDDIGIYGPTNTYSSLFRCVAKNNGSFGFSMLNSYLNFIGCMSIGNGNSGFYAGGLGFYLGCVSHDNINYGFHCLYRSNQFNCVADDNSVGGTIVNQNPGTVFGCRFTNNASYGLVSDTNAVIWSYYNFLLNNGVAPYLEIGTSRIEKIGSLTAGIEGYNDRANDDFNLISTATLRRTEIALPDD